MIKTEDYRVYAIESLREYIVYNAMEINDKDDLIKIYIMMREDGYFFKAEINKKMDIVKKTLNDFTKLYEEDPAEAEEDLIMFGANRILRLIDQKKKGPTNN